MLRAHGFAEMQPVAEDAPRSVSTKAGASGVRSTECRRAPLVLEPRADANADAAAVAGDAEIARHRAARRRRSAPSNELSR